VRFWDASAIVALCVAEDGTDSMDELLGQDPEIAVWWATPVECASALARRRREGRLSPAAEHAAHEVLDTLAATWYEVQAGFLVRSHALRLLRVHPLRAADSRQLAAALVWGGFPPAGAMVTLDDRLGEVARLEGLDVLGLGVT
jgi:predicted nucleic acid-binding protein